MPPRIDFAAISPDDFEHLCIDLWFDEGYADIKPYGGSGDAGRDAVYVDRHSDKQTLFQFKRWTGRYSISDIKLLCCRHRHLRLESR